MRLKKANKNIKKVASYIASNIDAFKHLNLKLYDLSYYFYKDFEKEYNEKELDYNDLFYDFCNVSYDCMIEYFTDNNITFDPEYIGHTSSFYISKYYNLSYDINEIIVQLLNNNAYQYNVIPDIENLCIVLDDWCEEDSTNIDYIGSNDFIKDCYNDLRPIIFIYDYIAEFKENQIATFKDFYLSNFD